MTVEMSPQDENVFGNSPDNDRDADINSEPCLEPDIGPDSDLGFISDLERVPRGTELREELSGILSMAS